MSRIIESFLLLSKEEKIALCAVSGAVVAYAVYRWNTTNSDQLITQIETMDEDEVTTEQEEEFDEYRKGNSNKVLTLGLTASGKSSLVTRFIYDEASKEYEPTNGFNIKNLSINGQSVEIWEIGGKMSNYWYTYLPGTGVLVFVVDASDATKFSDVRQELEKLFDNDGLKLEGTKFVVLLNKQDLTGGSLDQQTIDQILPNESFQKSHVIEIIQTSLLKADTDEFNKIKDTVLQLLQK